MREMIKMILVVTILSVASGGLLAYVKQGTAAQIENQELINVKGPAIGEILKGVTNDPIQDRFKLDVGGAEKSFFVGVMDGRPDVVAFETTGEGYGGTIGVMVAVNTDTDKIVGVRVTTHSETPGLGARSKSDPAAFVDKFNGMEIEQVFKVKADGGDVDALGGATITSRGVCVAVTKAGELYKKYKAEIVKQAKAFA